MIMAIETFGPEEGSVWVDPGDDFREGGGWDEYRSTADSDAPVVPGETDRAVTSVNDGKLSRLEGVGAPPLKVFGIKEAARKAAGEVMNAEEIPKGPVETAPREVANGGAWGEVDAAG